MPRLGFFVLALTLACAGLPATARAETVKGFHFSHGDWEVACDNTRTCRAAGYHPDLASEDSGSGLPISVLLVRNAGPGAPVTGRVMLGHYDENRLLDQLPASFPLSLVIDGKPVGSVTMQKDAMHADLSADQLAALLPALLRDSRIHFTHGTLKWPLSDVGAAAVLLKMDDAQGRIGTPGALARKGTRKESSVHPPRSVPVVQMAALPAALPGDENWIAQHGAALLKALRGTLKEEDDCGELLEADYSTERMRASRLSATRLVITASCWAAAYNSGEGVWIVNDRPPYRPQKVTTSATMYEDGWITAWHKGRGLADCVSQDRWAWNGERFVHAVSSTSGQCRLIAPGGTWELSTLVTDVRPARQPDNKSDSK